MVPATKVSRQGYSVELASLLPADVAALKKDLTMVPRTNAGGPQQPKPTSYPLYRANASKIYCPVNFGLKRFGPPTKGWALDAGEPMSEAARSSFRGELRPVQVEAVRDFLCVTQAEPPSATGGILSLPCGFGKTICAIFAVAKLGRRTMIIVHKLFLEAQWIERIAEFLPGASVGAIRADKVDVEGRDIVIASLQSLALKDYDPALFAQFGTLVVDECHRIGTECFSQALRKVVFRHTLGLSATVQRKDGCTNAFTFSLGDVLYRVKRSDAGVMVVQARFFDADECYSREELVYGGKLNTARMINNITRWEPRTRAIADAIVGSLVREPGRKVLVLSDRKDHLSAIKALVEADAPRLIEAGVDIAACSRAAAAAAQAAAANTAAQTKRKAKAVSVDCGDVCGFYVGGMKPAALDASAARKVVLATFAFASEGFDVAAMDTLVLASPKTDIEQSVGRILRLRAQERTRMPLILDFADDFSVFARQAAKRRTFYKRHGYSVLASMDALWDRACGEAATNDSDSGSSAPDADNEPIAFVQEDDSA